MMSATDTQQHVTTLLQEIDIYLSGFDLAGVQDVRRGLARWGNGKHHAMTPRFLPPCAMLPEALSAMAHRPLADAITAVLPHLHWITYDAYPRTDIGEAFADGHAFASLVGEGAFRTADDYDLGLFVIAPNTLYRDHHHAAPELYAPLTGPHGWRFLPDKDFHSKPADEPVWNEPWAPHATLTGDVPFLCIFAWTRDVNIPAKVIFTEQ
jgi:hypothetical protein